jgi:hypothetical protein
MHNYSEDTYGERFADKRAAFSADSVKYISVYERAR